MKPLYLLTIILILTIANCITTTSYYPEGIENKQNGEVRSNKSAKPKVNLSINGNWEQEYKANSFVAVGAGLDPSFSFLGAFQHDPNSPIFLKVDYSNSPSGSWAMWFCSLSPCIWSSSATYLIQYGSEKLTVNRKLEIVKRVYLLFPFSGFGYAMTSNSKENEVTKFLEIERSFVLSLREEIAKIAPLADPESDTPQTADLPKSFNDIVVLKNGDILEGVHTKVTPTTLEVTESNGKKTIYKKSQVLSVKKK
jgi:hypothetical protein